MKKLKPDINISVNAHDCTGSIDAGWPLKNPTPEDLEAIGKTFFRAAEAVRNREHGAIECGDNYASIGIDWGGPFTDDGLPILENIQPLKLKTKQITEARLDIRHFILEAGKAIAAMPPGSLTMMEVDGKLLDAMQILHDLSLGVSK